MLLAVLSTAVLQASPQRVERTRELLFCDRPSEWSLEERTAIRISGTTTVFDEQVTPLWTREKSAGPEYAPAQPN